MSNSPNGPTTFATTITSGIQDISALLPLLGTDQCEHHVASALAEGYLYAAASPLSIFGIIGIAKAGIKTLLATFSLPSSQITRGAAHLQDAGFRPVGESLALIMMDPDHRGRHLAESKFDDLYKKNKLVEAGEDFSIITPWKERKFPISLFHLLRRTITLVVSSLLLFPILIVLASFGQVGYTKTWAAKQKARILKLSNVRNQVQGIRALDWNTRLIAMTAVMSAISICPYIPLIVTPSKLSYRIKLTFPILRAVGGLLVVICIQILIELRLSRILRCRLALHRLDHEVRDNIHAFKDDHGTPTPVWNYRHSAELCLESMHKYLQSAYPDEERTDSNQPTRYCFNIFWPSTGSAASTASRSTDVEAGEKTASDGTPKSMQELKRHVAEERKKAAAQILWPYHLLLAVGIISLLVGYVGCFSVVQNTIPSKNPPIWLGLEAALSLLRLVLWASNPKFDDARPITVKLKCDPKPHLPCCLCKPQTITYSTKDETELYRVTAWSRKARTPIQEEYKELLWILKAHSSSDWLNLVIPQADGLGTNLNKIEYVHGSTTAHHLDLDILPESIARVLSDKDCQLHIFANSSSQDSLALKVYTSYLVRENAELELIVFAGCKTWLDKSPGHLERMRHRASHAQSTIKQRRSSLDKLLGLWLDHDEDITVLTRWHRGRILELDRLWASSFKRGLTIDVPATPSSSSPLLTPDSEDLGRNLRTLRKKLRLDDFPYISIPQQNIPEHHLSWKKESDFRIGYAELQEYINILPSESICFSGDNLNFDSLDPPRSQQPNDRRSTYALHLHVPTKPSAKYPETIWQIIQPVLRKLALTQDQRQRLVVKACSHSNTPNQQILVKNISSWISSEDDIPDSAVGSLT